MNKKLTISKQQHAERENQMNFFVLLSVVKTLQNYTLYTHRRTFSLSRTYSYKENYTENKQFFLLAIRAQQKDSKIFSPTYLINIQPSCSLNGFSASNQTLHTKKTESTREPEGTRKKVGKSYVYTLKERKASRRCLICCRNSLFLQKSFANNSIQAVLFHLKQKKNTCNMLFYICSFVVCVLLFIS